MKILIVSQYFWPESFVINGLAIELKRKGHQVSVLTGLPNYPSGEFARGYSFFRGPWTENYEGVKVMRVPVLPRGLSILRLAINYLSFALTATFFSLFHSIQNYDIIFCYGVSPVTACLPAIFIRYRTKASLLFWVQDLWPESVSAVGAVKAHFYLKWLNRLVKYIYQRCDLILVQSVAFKKSIFEKGIPNDKVKYVPNWAERFPEQISEPKWIHDLPSGFKIGFAGNIGLAQDLPTLLRAAEILKDHSDVKWIVVGDGSEKKWLDEEIKRRGLEKSVITVGRKDYQDMKPFFASCDVLYVSLKRSDIFSLTIPSKVQAYMSAAKPLIAAIDGEGARIIEISQSGFVAPAENPEALVAAILKFINCDENTRNKMGQNAFHYYQNNYDRAQVIEQIESLMYSQIKK